MSCFSFIFVFLHPGVLEEEEGLTDSLSDCLSSLSVGEWDDDVLSDLWHFTLSFLWNLRTTSKRFSFPSLFTFIAAGQTYKPVVICQIGDLNKEVFSVYTSPCVVNFSALQWQQEESFCSFHLKEITCSVLISEEKHELNFWKVSFSHWPLNKCYLPTWNINDVSNTSLQCRECNCWLILINVWYKVL